MRSICRRSEVSGSFLFDFIAEAPFGEEVWQRLSFNEEHVAQRSNLISNSNSFTGKNQKGRGLRAIGTDPICTPMSRSVRSFYRRSTGDAPHRPPPFPNP